MPSTIGPPLQRNAFLCPSDPIRHSHMQAHIYESRVCTCPVAKYKQTTRRQPIAMTGATKPGPCPRRWGSASHHRSFPRAQVSRKLTPLLRSTHPRPPIVTSVGGGGVKIPTIATVHLSTPPPGKQKNEMMRWGRGVMMMMMMMMQDRHVVSWEFMSSRFRLWKKISPMGGNGLMGRG